MEMNAANYCHTPRRCHSLLLRIPLHKQATLHPHFTPTHSLPYHLFGALISYILLLHTLKVLYGMMPLHIFFLTNRQPTASLPNLPNTMEQAFLMLPVLTRGVVLCTTGTGQRGKSSGTSVRAIDGV